MSKPTTEERIEAITIIRKLIKNYGVQYTSDVSDGVLTELDNRVKKLERELAALLSPAPKAPRKSKAVAALPKLPLPVDTGSSEPIATFTPDKFYGSRRGRNGKSE